MKFALACYGTRGDVEPSVSIGRELERRGHEVNLAVPPDLVPFAEEAGLATVSYGPKLSDFLQEDFLRNFWAELARRPLKTLRELWQPIVHYWDQTGATLKSLADGVDLLSTGLNYEQPAANIAEYYDIPLVTLHHFPMRPNGQLVPMLPPTLVRSAGSMSEWMLWRMTKDVDNAQRRELGLGPTTRTSARRIADRGTLEIQGYDAVSVPGLAKEWARWGPPPFVGALTMSLSTDVDNEVTSWIADGPPPICFVTGSIPVKSPAETVEMISATCSQLDQRALLCGGGTDFTGILQSEHVKVVGAVNYAEVFPLCRAVIHHGGSGTTAASLRAGIPTLILWSSADQPYWGNQVQRLGVGTARRLSRSGAKTLVTDIRRILRPEYATRARELAAQMTSPAESVSKAADLFERSVIQ